MDNETALLIERMAKNTVGYAESENKESFMTGMSVGVRKAEDVLGKEIEALRRKVDFYKTAYENVSADITTIVNVFKKYGTNE